MRKLTQPLVTLNNHLGVPLTILSQDTSVHEFSVIEAGINQRDEMATLAKMIDPEYVIVTSIGNSHLEGLGTIEGVALKKPIYSRFQKIRRGYFLVRIV